MSKDDEVSSEESSDDIENRELIPQDSSSLEEPQQAEEPIEINNNRPPTGKRRLVRMDYSEVSIGPLPPPDFLARYDEIVPGSAELIIRQFVAQGEHRRELEKLVVQGDNRRANLGLIAGIAIGLIGVVGALILLSLGMSGEGIVTLLLSLSPIIGSLIYADRKREAERKSKAIQVPELPVKFEEQ